MIYLSLVTFLLTGAFFASASLTNTTDFYNSQTGMKLLYQSFTGFEDVDWYYPKSTASIYYSLWQGVTLPWQDKSTPLILWFQGGPGGSSQFGCFNQIGPIFINGKKPDLKPVENPWSWNSYGHLMCVDQPLGVGFSYNKNGLVNNSYDAADHFINFMTNFYNNNPNFNLKENPLYLAGESYAGHYIPVIADKILSNSSLGFNLKGIMIGDAYIDPSIQINNYDSYLNSVGAVSNHWRDTTSFMANQAISFINKGEYQKADNYTNFIIEEVSTSQKYYNGMNVLNYKQYDEGNINPDYSVYLQSKKTKFGVPADVNFVDSNQKMYYHFDDFSKSCKKELERILNRGLKTLLYNGQNDFIVNTPGVLALLNSLAWVNNKQWKSSKKKIWNEFGGNNLGWYKQYRNLNFVLVRNAGHLLPSDQPRAAWYMLRNFFSYWPY